MTLNKILELQRNALYAAARLHSLSQDATQTSLAKAAISDTKTNVASILRELDNMLQRRIRT